MCVCVGGGGVLAPLGKFYLNNAPINVKSQGRGRGNTGGFYILGSGYVKFTTHETRISVK